MEWIAEEPTDIPRLFANAWNERKPEKIANLFFEQAEFVNVVGLWWHTRKDIYRAHKYGLEVIFKNSHLNVTKTKTTVVREDIAVVHAKMHLSGQSEQNEKTPKDRYNIFTFVVRNTDKGWLCLSAHNTDIISGAETNIRDEEGYRGVSYR